MGELNPFEFGSSHRCKADTNPSFIKEAAASALLLTRLHRQPSQMLDCRWYLMPVDSFKLRHLGANNRHSIFLCAILAWQKVAHGGMSFVRFFGDRNQIVQIGVFYEDSLFNSIFDSCFQLRYSHRLCGSIFIQGKFFWGSAGQETRSTSSKAKEEATSGTSSFGDITLFSCQTMYSQPTIFAVPSR